MRIIKNKILYLQRDSNVKGNVNTNTYSFSRQVIKKIASNQKKFFKNAEKDH